jgi:hypothetical protein
MSDPIATVVCSMRSARIAVTSIELCAYDGRHFRLLSSHPFAPGQPLTVTAPLSSSVDLELKSLGSVKQPDGRYEVRARPMTLSRHAKTALEAHFHVTAV